MSGPPPRDRQDSRRPADLRDAWIEPSADGEDRASSPLFHAREIYRRRRVMDAARLLPALGTALLLMPMLWAREHGTAAGAVYLFVIWLLLILASAFMSARLAEPLSRSGRPQEDDGEREER